jgi:hypothetical protein
MAAGRQPDRRQPGGRHDLHAGARRESEKTRCKPLGRILVPLAHRRAEVPSIEIADLVEGGTDMATCSMRGMAGERDPRTGSGFRATWTESSAKQLPTPTPWKKMGSVVKLAPGDIVAYQAVDYRVEGVLDYALPGHSLRLVSMVAGGQTRLLEPVVVADRLLVLSEIAPLDIDSPPPATIYHRGESYLLKLSGRAVVTIAGQVTGRQPGACDLWRFRAAGGQFLQIEAWADGIHMLAGATVHKGMLEVRPATP